MKREEEEEVGEVLALQRREQYECRRVEEGVWGAFHSSAQTQTKKRKQKKKKKKMCSENPDFSATLLLSHPPLPHLLPSVSSTVAPEGGVSSCVLVFDRVFLFEWQFVQPFKSSLGDS